MSEPVPNDAAPEYRVFVPFTNDELAELDGAHEDIRVVTGAIPPPKRWKPEEKQEPPWEVVFRKAQGGEGDFFEGHAHSEQAKAKALRLHAKTLIVGVSVGGVKVVCLNRLDNKQKGDVQKAWDRLREKFPGVHMAAQDEIMDLTGMGKEEAGKG